MKKYVLFLLCAVMGLAANAFGKDFQDGKKIVLEKKIVPTHEFLIVTESVLYVEELSEKPRFGNDWQCVIVMEDGTRIFTNKSLDTIAERMDEETFRIEGHRHVPKIEAKTVPICILK